MQLFFFVAVKPTNVSVNRVKWIIIAQAFNKALISLLLYNFFYLKYVLLHLLNFLFIKGTLNFLSVIISYFICHWNGQLNFWNFEDLFRPSLSVSFIISKLQRAQNVLARVVTRSHRRTAADALLHELHWLPIEDRNVFKLALLTYKTLLIGSPSYLSTLLTIYRPPRTLRSSNSNLLCATRTKTVTGSRAFRCAAPAIWNSLPADNKSACSIESFRTKLKTFLFRQSCA